jgi:hypothetical protein
VGGGHSLSRPAGHDWEQWVLASFQSRPHQFVVIDIEFDEQDVISAKQN